MQVSLIPEVRAALQICPSSGLPCDCGAAAAVAPGAVITTDSADKLKFGGSALPSKPGCEPIFPSELRSRVAQPLELPGKRATWYRCADDLDHPLSSSLYSNHCDRHQ